MPEVVFLDGPNIMINLAFQFLHLCSTSSDAYFACAKSNAKEGKQRIFLICMRFSSCEVRRLNLSQHQEIILSATFNISFFTLWQLFLVYMNVVPRSTGNTNSGTRELTLKCKL